MLALFDSTSSIYYIRCLRIEANTIILFLGEAIGVTQNPWQWQKSRWGRSMVKVKPSYMQSCWYRAHLLQCRFTLARQFGNAATWQLGSFNSSRAVILFRQEQWYQLCSSTAQQLGSSAARQLYKLWQRDNLTAWVRHMGIKSVWHLGSLASWWIHSAADYWQFDSKEGTFGHQYKQCFKGTRPVLHPPGSFWNLILT